jgi:hypothetical protein
MTPFSALGKLECECKILDREEYEEQREWLKRCMCIFHWMQTDYYRNKVEMILLSDRIQEFIDWLEANTDYADWNDELKTLVHRQLIICMISDKTDDTNTN